MTRFDVSLIDELAGEFAAWRIGGCPGYGFAERFRVKVAKAARKAGSSPSALFAEVHRAAYVLIDADYHSASARRLSTMP